MKFYISHSISQLTDKTKKSVERVVERLEGSGHTVISKFNLNKKLVDIKSQSEKESIEEQKRLTKLKKNADIVIVEASYPSFGVGQEISISLSLNKPVIVLYQKGKSPHILRDENGDLLILAEYTDENLVRVLDDSIDYASSNQDVRFNFFISPTIGNYLDWISQNKKIPRSVYLRNLIELDMESNEEFNS